MGRAGDSEERDGVTLTNLDQALFADAGATKREFIDYLDAVSGPLIDGLRDRPLSVVRILRGQAPFMQKNLPKYTPEWVPTVTRWAESSKRDVTYALCNDRRTLLWFGNQRAVEFHPTLSTITAPDPSQLVLDIDPPPSPSFAPAVRAAALVRQVLDDAKLAGVVKTSGAKGLHVFVPIVGATAPDAAAATRALAIRAERLDPDLATTAFVREERDGKVFLDSTRAAGATVVAAYSPRLRPGLTVSFPVAWDDLDDIVPTDFTVRTVPPLLAGTDPWRERMPAPQQLSQDLIDEGHLIPVARVQAMHAGKRRARVRRAAEGHENG
jgi:bifunctional non-homologous end joining protein LigD